MLALVALVAVLGSLLAVVSPPPAAHAEVTGTGGQYVPVTSNARVFNGATTANTYKRIPVAGVAGLPSSGIGAVTMMITVADPQGTGQLFARPSADESSTLMMVYNSGVGGNTSNSSLLAVGDDGALQIMTETAQTHVIIDITGYYTSTQNGVGAGGLVPMAPTRFVDSRSGLGVPKAQLDGGDSVSFQVTGKNGVPAGAAAVAANIIVINQQAAAGWIRATPSGVTPSTGVLNYNSTSGLSTAMSAQVALGSDGKITLDTASGAGLIDVIVDIQGYFLPANPGGGFTPQAGRLVDTRKTASIASGATFSVQVGGARDGVPTVDQGLSAAALTFTAVNTSASDTYAQVYADGAAVPTGSAINSDATSIITNTIVAPIGANGAIRVRNNGPTAMNYVIDLQGTYNSLPGGPAATNQTGQRPSATTLPFTITDQTSASVDVGTGNLLLTTSALSLPGATQNTVIGAAYNSRASNVANSNTMDANRWQYALAGAGDLSANAAGVLYTDAAGTAWQFTSTGTAGVFTSPAGLQQTLSRVNTSGTSYEYQLKGWTTNQVVHFNLAGQPTSVVDRNGNQISFNAPNGYTLTTLVSTAGVAGAKTANSSYANSTQTFSQTSGSSTRSVSWAKNSTGDITTYTDATGKHTTFGYTNGDLTSITAPNGAVTVVTYDSSDRVTAVEQRNTTAGSAGTAVTRFSYASATTTQVADPRSDQSQSVAAAAHTTYTLDGNDLVLNAVDAAGRQRSRTYNPANNGVATATVGTGSTPTSTATYSANNSQSLTKVASAGGASQSLGYQASPAATAYLPQTSTDDAGNAVQLGYDGVGNQTSSSTGSGTTAATSTLTYTAGQVATATAPGNGTNKTTYNYTNKQLTSITPVSITPTTGSAALGARAYTYDAFGRIASASDGAGRTTSYTYDGDDRVLTTSFSDGTPTVTNTYDTAGHLLTQASGSGTVTNTYDQLGHLLTTANTASPAALSTITYGYDKSGNQTSYTDQDGTVTSAYDASGVLTSTTTPAANGTETIHFVTDTNGRRTDTYVDANADNSTWASHTHTDYDASGRIQELQGWVGPSSTNNQRIYDLYYCYNAGSITPNCGTTTTNDRSKIQWVTDYQSGQSTAYTYDSRGRITKTVTTGSGTATPGTWEFGYDIRGNRTSAKFTTPGGSVTTNQTLTYNAANQITSPGFKYDGAGNLTAVPEYTFNYNGAEQMTSAVHNGSQTTTYTYAGTDQKSLLSLSTQGGDTTSYQYGRVDQNGNPTLTSSTRNGNRANIVNDAVTGQPIALATPSGVLGQYASDGSGNPFGLLTDSPAAFSKNVDPYGTETVTYDGGGDGLVSNPFAFKTGIDDTVTGLIKFGQRWYDPYLGAWTQQDTLDSPLDLSNGNRYAYAASDPINGSDPTGQLTGTEIRCGLAFLGVATIFGVLAGTVVGGLVASAAVAGGIGQLTALGTGVAGIFACA